MLVSPQIIAKMAKVPLSKFSQLWDEEIPLKICKAEKGNLRIVFIWRNI